MSKVNGGAFYLLLFYASLVPSIKHSRAINSGHTVGILLTLKAKCFHQRLRSKVGQAAPLKIVDMDEEKCHKIQCS